MYKDIINTLRDKKTPKDLLEELFKNETLKNSYPNEIRRSTIIGKIANTYFEQNKLNYSIKIMAIGDMKYFGDLKITWEKIIQKSLKNIQSNDLMTYDLNSQGTEKLRQNLFEYMNEYYNFSHLKNQIGDHIIPSYGGTDALVLMLDTLRQKFYKQKVNFIFPEASFMASANIAESNNFNNIAIPKPSKDNFFISTKQIDDLYNTIQKDQNIFYITAVGNPTGSKIGDQEYEELILYIADKDPKAIIILDNVYVPLLEKSSSAKMFKNILNNSKLLSNNFIFCESLSKTLGTTGIRFGFLWTLNIELSNAFKKNNILKKAGFSKILNDFGTNLLSNIEEIKNFETNISKFISNQRINFLDYMQKNFKELFDFEKSPKINPNEGIYVLLKLKQNINPLEVFAITSIIGVKVNLSDGIYIRYSFGNTNYF